MAGRLLLLPRLTSPQTRYLLYFLAACNLPEGMSPETAVGITMMPLLIAAAIAPPLSGLMSDRLGGRRKWLVTFAACVMVGCLVGFAFTRSMRVLPFVAAGFGIGFGVFNSLDFALALDVVDGPDSAKELGLWNLSLALPLCVAAPIGGVVLDAVTKEADESTAFQALFGLAALYILLGTAAILKLRHVS